MMYQKLTERLRRRFSGANDEHITAALNDGITSVGYEVVEAPTEVVTPGDDLAEATPTVITTNVTPDDVPLLLALVSYELASDLATNAASYFSYTDGSESIDKTNVMENYRALATTFKAEYENELEKREAALQAPATTFHIMKRADRSWRNKRT